MVSVLSKKHEVIILHNEVVEHNQVEQYLQLQVYTAPAFPEFKESTSFIL